MMKKINYRTRIVLTVAVFFVFLGFSGVFSGNASSENESESKENKNYAQAQMLAGRWVRPDGGYTLVLDDIKPDGSLKASYYNPKKINVHEANWKVDNDNLQLFIELRDVNYPGSKYNLVYRNKTDVLRGTYFQATQKQTFSVTFSRISEI